METIEQQPIPRSHSQLKVELPAPLHAEIKRVALSRGMSMRSLVEQALEREVEQRGRQNAP